MGRSRAPRPARPAGARRRGSATSPGRDAPLGARTTYRVGGPAGAPGRSGGDTTTSRRCPPRSPPAGGGVPVLVVGKGSNLLVADAGFPGLAVGGRPRVRRHRRRRRRRCAPAAGRRLPGRGAAHRRGRGSTGFEWGRGRARLHRGRGAHERRRPRFRHGAHRWRGRRDVRPGRAGPTAVRAAEPAGARIPHGGRGAPHRGGAVGGARPAGGPRRRRPRPEIAAVVRWRRAHRGGPNAGSVLPTRRRRRRAAGEGGGAEGGEGGAGPGATKHANFVQARRRGDGGGRGRAHRATWPNVVGERFECAWSPRCGSSGSTLTPTPRRDSGMTIRPTSTSTTGLGSTGPRLNLDGRANDDDESPPPTGLAPEIDPRLHRPAAGDDRRHGKRRSWRPIVAGALVVGHVQRARRAAQPPVLRPGTSPCTGACRHQRPRIGGAAGLDRSAERSWVSTPPPPPAGRGASRGLRTATVRRPLADSR